MEVQVLGKNLAITPALRAYVEKKVRRLQRPLQGFGTDLRAQATLRIDGNDHVVEITVPLLGMVLRAEEATADMYASVDLAVDKLLRQVERYRHRVDRRREATGSTGKGNSDAFPVGGGAGGGAGDGAEAPAQQVVRIKRFAVKPQTLEEAIVQLELLGHDFYVFREAVTGQVQVLYRRKRGQLGLIVPE